jgi:hypothetical protein
VIFEMTSTARDDQCETPQSIVIILLLIYDVLCRLLGEKMKALMKNCEKRNLTNIETTTWQHKVR